MPILFKLTPIFLKKLQYYYKSVKSVDIRRFLSYYIVRFQIDCNKTAINRNKWTRNELTRREKRTKINIKINDLKKM